MVSPAQSQPYGTTPAPAYGATETQSYAAQGKASSFGVSKGSSKPFFLTSEFLVYVVSVFFVLLVGYVDDGMSSFDTWLLVTILSGAYILSRGFAKTGGRGTSPHSLPGA